MAIEDTPSPPDRIGRNSIDAEREPVALLLGLGRGPDAAVVAPQPVVTPQPTLEPPAQQVPSAAPRSAAADVSIERALEAILMVADEPQSLVGLAAALDRPVTVVRQAIARLVADYDGAAGGVRRGFELREVGGGWRIYSRAEYDSVVRDFVITQNPSKLSQAALETLAVVAYRQPISRGQIAAIRAVNVDGVVRTLVSRGLIAEIYTDSETGAIHYGTTPQTLIHLGINSLDELPPISPLLADPHAVGGEA